MHDDLRGDEGGVVWGKEESMVRGVLEGEKGRDGHLRLREMYDSGGLRRSVGAEDMSYA